MTMEHSFDFLRISEALYEDFQRLFRASFGINLNMKEIRGKFNTDYTGVKHLGFVALDKKTRQAAAYYGVIPLIAQYNGQKILCAQSGDTMTHPEYRGKGLFVALAKETYSLCKAEGVHIVFGFPNQNSYPGFIRKLDWVHYSDMHQYVVESGFPIPLEKAWKKWHLQKYIHTFWDKRFAVSEDNYFENSLAQEEVCEGFILHNKEFFTYKSFQKFYFTKLSSGTYICFKLDGRLWIGDLSRWNNETFDEDLKDIRILARKLGIKYIHFHVQKGTRADALLSQKAFLRNRFPLGGLNISGLYDVTRMAFTSLDYDTF
jgi:GNAT superfamily N-acetyltransferase